MSVIQQLLTDHIDIWTAAETEKTSGRGRASRSAASVYGIKKLRELILDLAVRGKLVAQNASEEPARELLNRIKTAKAKLLSEGKIKKDRRLAPLADTDKYFELPTGWEWSRLGEYGDVGSSSRVHQKDWTTSGIPFYRAREIVLLSRHGSVDNELFISEELFRELTAKGLVPEADDLMITGVGTIGVPYVVAKNDKFYFKDASVLIFKNNYSIFTGYLFLFLTTPTWNKKIHSESMGTTVHTLTIARANEVALPIPPLAEQHRIVAKVDELMALCDQLEAQHSNAADAHEQLVSHLLGTLTRSRSAADFNTNWQRIVAHFDTLFTTEASIDTLKQTLLQLAVMGKLVEQDANDEPAGELLKRIEAEKANLVANGKIKKSKPFASISDNEKLFDLPQRWCWVRFGEISTIKSELVQPENFQDFRQIAPDCIEKGTGLLTESRTVKEAKIMGPNSRFYSGQIVYSKIRPALSKAVLVDFDGLCSADMYPIDVFINSKFMLKVILSECFLEQVRAAENRIKMPKLNQESLTAFILPLPPLAEQIRIVKKIDQLTMLCDNLRSRITDTNRHQKRLADVLVEHTVVA